MPWYVAKIQKFSKAICILLVITLVFYVVGVIAFFITHDWSFGQNPENISRLMHLVNINSIIKITIPLSEGGLLTIGLSGILGTIASLWFAIKVFRILWREGSPFRMEIVYSLKWLAITLLIVGLTAGLTGLIPAAIVWVLRYVFEYGCQLQQESDTLL